MDNSVIKRLADLSRMLEAATEESGRLDEAAILAKIEYEKVHTATFLRAEGLPVEVRKQEANLAAMDQRLAMEIAQKELRLCQERIRTIRVQIDVGRSIGAAQRAEFAAGGSVT